MRWSSLDYSCQCRSLETLVTVKFILLSSSNLTHRLIAIKSRLIEGPGQKIFGGNGNMFFSREITHLEINNKRKLGKKMSKLIQRENYVRT